MYFFHFKLKQIIVFGLKSSGTGSSTLKSEPMYLST